MGTLLSKAPNYSCSRQRSELEGAWSKRFRHLKVPLPPFLIMQRLFNACHCKVVRHKLYRIDNNYMEEIRTKKSSIFYSLHSGNCLFEEFTGKQQMLVFSDLENLFQSNLLSFEDLKIYTLLVIIKITECETKSSLSEQVFDFGSDSVIHFGVVFLC